MQQASPARHLRKEKKSSVCACSSCIYSQVLAAQEVRAQLSFSKWGPLLPPPTYSMFHPVNSTTAFAGERRREDESEKHQTGRKSERSHPSSDGEQVISCLASSTRLFVVLQVNCAVMAGCQQQEVLFNVHLLEITLKNHQVLKYFLIIH